MSDLKCLKKIGDDFVEISLLDLRKGDLFKTSTGGMEPQSAGGFFPAVWKDQIWEVTSDPFFNKEKGWGIETEKVNE